MAQECPRGTERWPWPLVSRRQKCPAAFAMGVAPAGPTTDSSAELALGKMQAWLFSVLRPLGRLLADRCCRSTG